MDVPADSNFQSRRIFSPGAAVRFPSRRVRIPRSGSSEISKTSADAGISRSEFGRSRRKVIAAMMSIIEPRRVTVRRPNKRRSSQRRGTLRFQGGSLRPGVTELFR
jgi:hypothetical protein